MNSSEVTVKIRHQLQVSAVVQVFTSLNECSWRFCALSLATLSGIIPGTGMCSSKGAFVAEKTNVDKQCLLLSIHARLGLINCVTTITTHQGSILTVFCYSEHPRFCNGLSDLTAG